VQIVVGAAGELLLVIVMLVVIGAFGFKSKKRFSERETFMKNRSRSTENYCGENRETNLFGPLLITLPS
jgi:hypothetical protein